MEAFQIALGEKIELIPQLSDGTYSSNTYSSKVQDILAENEFLIISLTDQKPDSWVGRVFQVTVIRENEAYVGAARIEKVVSEGNLVFFDLILAEGFKRRQRRDFYRLKIGVEIEIDGSGAFQTFDLSAGGLMFISGRKFSKSETLAITLNLSGELFDVCGVVVRCANAPEGKFLVSVNFKDIGELLQDEIAKFIQKQQLGMMKKGILRR